MSDQKKPEPKFKVGQVVVMNSTKKQMPFRIVSVIWGDIGEGWFYGWNSKNALSERSIRLLTHEEAGILSDPLCPGTTPNVEGLQRVAEGTEV
jgi:hypothetical protein